MKIRISFLILSLSIFIFSTCKKEETCSPNLVITKFELISPVYLTCIIEEGSNTIYATVPHGTDLSKSIISVEHPALASINWETGREYDLINNTEPIILSCDENSVSYELEIRYEAPVLPLFIRPWYRAFDGAGIGTACFLESKDDVLIFNQEGTEYKQIVNGQVQGWFFTNSNSSTARLRNCPFTSIGVAHYQNGAIYVLDKSGMNYAASSSLGIWTESIPLRAWGVDNTHPFLNATGNTPAGVSAGLGYYCCRSIHFDQSGTRWSLYNPNSGRFGQVYDLSDWSDTEEFPFEKVGAALQVETDLSLIYPTIGNTLSRGLVHVFFNEAGTKLVFHHYSYGFSTICPII